jgi:3-deoxy-D-manno-octulosonate 8-phosphate phosphatase (KDO 8-P phosphatase)
MSDNGKFLKIKAFAFDVDGVLTDGGILADLNGELYRVFDSKDSMAIRMAVMKGFHMAIITGGRSESIRKRFETCGIKADDVYLGSRAKIEDFQDFCNRHKLAPEEVMYFGDDLPDIPVMQACGCGVCPSDAVDEVKAIADHVSTKPGGKGCAREILQAVM